MHGPRLLAPFLVAVAGVACSTPMTASRRAGEVKDQGEQTPTTASSRQDRQAAINTKPPAVAAAPSDGVDPEASVDEIERELAKKTATVFPDDPQMTADILSRFVDCSLLSGYIEAEKMRIEAQKASRIAEDHQKLADELHKDAEAARSQADEQLAQARKQRRAWIDSFRAHKKYLDFHFEPLEMQPIVMLMTKKITILDKFDYSVIDRWIEPPKRKIPRTIEVHPYDPEETMHLLTEACGCWSKVVESWPSGCGNKPDASKPSK